MPPEIPMPPTPGPPGSPPGAAKPPGAPAGPGGPGASPMLSPGAGLGAEASARMRVKKAHEALIEAINAFPVGSKEQQALLRVAQTLSLFAREAPAAPRAA